MGGPPIVGKKFIDELDNFFICSFVIDGITFNSTEQYFQYQKNSDSEYRKKLLSEKNQSVIWCIGNRCKLREDWEDIKYNVMYRANYEKFNQNKKLKDILLKTGNNPIIFSSSTEYWNKANQKILEDLRTILK